MKKPGIKKWVILAFTGSMSAATHAAIVINEIDYDQAGIDTAEFIELFNSAGSVISLDNYSIDLINGNDSSHYRSINLSGYNINASSYFVVCGDTNQVANCDYSFISTNSWFQNGAADAVALYQNSSLIDSLSYEGTLAPFTEADALTLSDNSTGILSIGRKFDGIDTDNNAVDFELDCITPGTANIAGSGDCSVSGISAIPLPAAGWLFASGFIGLAGFARRK
jgi:predicted extracellular nuclease